MSAVAKLARARLLVKPVTKSQTADTGKYTYTYASLGSVMEAVDAACAEVKLSWWQHIHTVEGGWQLDTVLFDLEDESPESQMAVWGGPINTIKADPQANGSALTYARRYGLTTLFGLNQEDDDGAMAHRAATTPNERTPAEKEIRRIVAGLPDAMSREDFQAEFITHFGATLSQLPESKHGDALTWTKERTKAVAQ